MVIFAAVIFAGCTSATPLAQFRPYTVSPEIEGAVVVAVGDIACSPGRKATGTTCHQGATARLAQAYSPEHVLALGDLQYETGTLEAFRSSYAASWGALKSITRPVPGNHEYSSPGAKGYYSFFRRQASEAPGYYAFDIGRWRLYAVNSNCSKIDCGRQTRWLDRRMDASPRRCSIVMMHHPRFSSGDHHGSSVSMTQFWRVAYQHGTDIALAGHDHSYERFARLDHDGNRAADGIQSFVSGAGGKNLYGFGDVVTGSRIRDNHAAGVLALKLGRTEYGWAYRTVDGELVDHGRSSCR